MFIDELSRLIEKLLPPETAMDGDRIGIQIEGNSNPVTTILATLEVTDGVIDEANSMNADTIITFHPLIFAPLTKVNDDDRVGRLVKKLIKSEINLISVHTSYDAFVNGTSKILSDKLDLNYIDFLVRDKNHENCGMGVIAETKEPLTCLEFVSKVSDIMSSPVRYNMTEKSINKVAILGGSGSSFIDDALIAEADAFITADVSYHKFHYVAGKMLIADPGHYEMEQFVGEGIKELLKYKLNDKNINIYSSKILTNPVRYYPQPEKYENEQNKYLINK